MNNKPSEASSTIPAASQEYVLRAMAKNYQDGNSWDHLDRETVIAAADEIKTLRAAITTPAPGRGELRERIARIIDPDAFDGLERERQWCRQNNKDETAWCSGYIKSTNAALAKSDKALNAILSELLIK